MEKPVSYKVFLQYLIGDWVLCTPDALNQSPEFKDALGEWGLVIDPDGRWAALYETDGELHRSTAWGTEGSWGRTVSDLEYVKVDQPIPKPSSSGAASYRAWRSVSS